MAIRGLTIEEMVAISSAWTSAGSPERAAIEQVPLLAALLPYLERAHGAVLEAMPRPEDPGAARLSEQQAALDAQHDQAVRAVDSAFTAVIASSSQPEPLLKLRAGLLPDGLLHTQRTYSGEAGHATRVEARLDQEQRARLAAVRLGETNLLMLVDRWLGVARQLGALEQERGKLSAAPAPGRAQVHEARTRWLRATSALLASADLAEIDAATDQRLFTQLRNVEAAADRRGVRKPGAEPAAPPLGATPAAAERN